MYGTQTILLRAITVGLFENDVKMYGTQTLAVGADAGGIV